MSRVEDAEEANLCLLDMTSQNGESIKVCRTLRVIDPGDELVLLAEDLDVVEGGEEGGFFK